MKKLLASIAAMTMATLTVFSMASCEQLGELGGQLGGHLGGLLDTILPQDSSSSDPADNSSSSSKPSKPAQKHEADLKDVKDFVYTPMLEQNVSTRVDYTVKNSYSFVGSEEVYDISWSVNVKEGVTIVEGEDADTVDISDTLEEDLPYVLTGTITCPEGCCSISFDLERTALKALNEVPVAITAKPVENTAYKLYVYQSGEAKDCYFTGNMDGYYFETSEISTDGVDIYVEYIDNSDRFNVYFTDADGVKQYIGVKLSDDGAHDNIVFATEPVSSFAWNAELGTITTHLEVNKEGNAADYYLGNYSYHTTFSASMLSYAETSNVGGLVTMVDKNDIVITDEKKVADIKKDLNVQETHTVDKTVELLTSDERYPEATITWTVEENKGATVTADGLVLVIPEEATTATLTATIKAGDVTDTKTFTLTLGPKTVAPDASNAAAIVEAAFSLAAGETLPGGNYTLTGEITEVNTAWSDQYSNITVTISVNDKEIECYRLVSGTNTDASVLKVGDTITVTGTIKNYNGKVEFDKNCTLDAYVAGEAPESTNPVLSFADTANRTELTEEKQVWVQNGITVTNNKASSTSNVADYSNPVRFYKSTSLTVEYEGMMQIVFLCDDYKASYVTDLVSSITNDSVTVTTEELKVIVTFAEATNSFTIETLAAQVRVDEITVYTKAQEGGEVTPPVVTPSTPAEIIDAAYALEEGASLEGTYTLTGKITEMGDWNSNYNDVNVTIVVEGKEDKPMYCYGLKEATEGQLSVGDTITVEGSIKNYRGTVEFDKPTLKTHVPAGPTDAEKVAEAKEALTLEVDGKTYTQPVEAFTLPTIEGVEITWTGNSSLLVWGINADIGGIVGLSIDLPEPETTTVITITATITSGEVSDTKEFTVTMTNEEKSAATKFETEYEALTLLQVEFSEATTIDLPTAKTYTDVTITWVSDSELATVTEDGKLVIALPETAEATVKVTATVSVRGIRNTKEFTLTIRNAAQADIDAVNAAKEALVLNVAELYTEATSLDLPTAEGVELTWTSDNEAVVKVEEGKVVITLPGKEEKASATLTATLKLNAAVATVTYTINVENLEKKDETKVADEKTALTIDTTDVTGEKEITLPLVGATYADVAIAWALKEESAIASIAEGKLSIEKSYKNSSITLTVVATLTLNDATETKEFTITVAASTEYKTVTIPEAIAAEDGTMVEVSGTVSVAGAWSDSYGNMNATIVDADGNSLYIFRLATKVALGDIITVKGAMATYNDDRQIGAGATAEITGHDSSYDYTEMTIAEAIAAEDDTNVIVTGTVVKIHTAYSESYNNISVYIADDNGTQLYLYRLTGNVELNQIIKVKGSMDTYNGDRQVAAGATFEAVGTHTCAIYTDATCTKPASCVVCGVAKDDVLLDHTYVEGTCSVCGATEGVVTETETFAIAANAGTLAADSLSISWSSDNFNYVGEKGTGNPIRTSDSDHFRVYKGAIFTISSKNDKQITKVVITATSADYATVLAASLTTEGVTATADGKTVTITVDSGSVESISFTATAQFRISNIEITYIK